ncbi:MAG: sigma-70 family RNA polymerase sigma factor [Leptospira sp.]|jgi:RNA polymerase sigma-70 factor, ECF subfamily|nr:sigma-70 family RNA polymerase sigma factor [Leptospira sp.]NCS93287.1 sigma-70 family RNA polymerase sigma factor [Leptospira sp.]
MIESKDSLNIEFEKIVSATKWAVLTAIQKYLNQDYIDSIDDVAQEVYLRIYKYLLKNGMENLRFESIGNWAYTISKNESLRFNSKKNRQNFHETELDLEIADHSENQFETGIIDKLEYDELLASLPKPYREVMQLTIEGLTGNEISAELNIANGTVKSRLSRARSILNEKFKI